MSGLPWLYQSIVLTGDGGVFLIAHKFQVQMSVRYTNVKLSHLSSGYLRDLDPYASLLPSYHFKSATRPVECCNNWTDCFCLDVIKLGAHVCTLDCTHSLDSHRFHLWLKKVWERAGRKLGTESKYVSTCFTCANLNMCLTANCHVCKSLSHESFFTKMCGFCFYFSIYIF